MKEYLINIWEKKKFYLKIWEKVSNIIRQKVNTELICNKKFLKAKKIHHKRKLSMIYIPVILIDPVYRKDEHYYPIVFLGNLIHNLFLRSIRNFDFWGFGSLS